MGSVQHQHQAGYLPHFVKAINNNTEIIVDAVMNRLACAPQGQPLILGYGELHETSTHVTLAHNIIHELCQRGIKMAFALEWPPNNIDKHIDDNRYVSEININRTKLKEFLQRPENNVLRNKLSAQTSLRTLNAKLSHTLLQQYLDNNGIHVYCADAMRDWINSEPAAGKQFLLQSDPQTATSIAQAQQLLGQNADFDLTPPHYAHTNLGQTARNFYTIQANNAVLQNTPDIQIIFMEMGRSHINGLHPIAPHDDVTGTATEDLPYEHNLAALYGTLQKNFLGVSAISIGEDITQIPIESQKDFNIIQTPYPLHDTRHNGTGFTDFINAGEIKYCETLKKYFEWARSTLGTHTAKDILNMRVNNLYSELKAVHDAQGFVPETAPLVAQR